MIRTNHLIIGGVTMSRSCVFCGREFVPLEGRMKYCSPKCREAAFYDAHPDYQKERERAKRPILQVICRHCGEQFETTNSKKIFCSNECKIVHYNALRKTTQKELRECPVCKKLFRVMQKTGIGRTYCTPVCRNKEMNRRRKAATQTITWQDRVRRKWRGNWYKALQRDEFTCQLCGRHRKPGEQAHDKRYVLDVHHKDGSGEGRGGNHSLENLITLCHPCHTEFHTKVNLIQVNGEYFVKGKIFGLLKLESVKTMS